MKLPIVCCSSASNLAFDISNYIEICIKNFFKTTTPTTKYIGIKLCVPWCVFFLSFFFRRNFSFDVNFKINFKTKKTTSKENILIFQQEKKTKNKKIKLKPTNLYISNNINNIIKEWINTYLHINLRIYWCQKKKIN